ncbi:nuclear transport factor 2 family protein [Curvibacter sp. HBC61]|uniref:Nuclear transport factor 2 family protein n=1 Tax=Curvibacter cyanobacteriorum TaxID=3026422 RepID=A0ABT5MTC7_9BURK|nr:nuclear transport factor 2 family protein [Curvibacter sp. HBC61]MDD0837285.1 nuclear transport factor 2 family protein [Curvibacter sp. HBC61]
MSSPPSPPSLPSASSASSASIPPPEPLTASEATRRAVRQYFELVKARRPGAELAALFSPTLLWDIPRNSLAIPWSGPVHNREQVADFIDQHRLRAQPKRFALHQILCEGRQAIATGELETVIKATGVLMRVDFAFHFTVEDGLITQLKIYESTYPLDEPAP